jgi:hypothetical protein
VEGVVLPEKLPEFLNDSNGDANLLSFIVHLWKEESDANESLAGWRGHITSVPNGERHYFSDINEIPNFLRTYLETL